MKQDRRQPARVPVIGIGTKNSGYSLVMTVAPGHYGRAAVVIPAHNERELLPDCVRAVVTAARAASVPVTIVVVLDDCDDGSDHYAGRFGSDVHFVTVAAHNVGFARAAGFSYARTLGLAGTDCWYATTDADSLVPADWLIMQLAHTADAVLGLVTAIDWSTHSRDVVARYQQAYYARVGRDHDHIHGANMGFNAAAYWHVGGFRSLSTEEDVDLVHRLEASAYRVHRDPALTAATSTRLEARAPLGFSYHLAELANPQPVLRMSAARGVDEALGQARGHASTLHPAYSIPSSDWAADNKQPAPQ